MLTIACGGMFWYWPEGSHNGHRPKDEGHYGCLKQPFTYSFIGSCSLVLTLGFNQAIMGFTRPLWILLGHYGSAIMGCVSLVRA